ENFHLNKPIGCNETGFVGSDDFTYRSQAWHFMLAGGALFNNLDYSFTVAKPDGSAPVSAPTPGGGSPALRKQLSILRSFLEGCAFTRMSPAPYLATLPDKTAFKLRCLAHPPMQFAVYLEGNGVAEVRINAATGNYRIEWINTRTGQIVKKERLESKSAVMELKSPP